MKTQGIAVAVVSDNEPYGFIPWLHKGFALSLEGNGMNPITIYVPILE